MTIYNIEPQAIRLKRMIRNHLRKIGFTKAGDGTLIPPSLDKESYRKIHSHQRNCKLDDNKGWIQKNWNELSSYFASGTDIDVSNISPRIEVVPSDSWQSNLFRLATYYWQIPVSVGFGRRMRFLVWDDFNNKLLGIFALGDAVFNLKVRDDMIEWDHHRRKESLVNLMDAYVLGALPPYNMILGGKLIACLIPTIEVVKAFRQKYSNRVGIISQKKKNPQLAAVTTSSAFGRSSLYNRLKLDGKLIFKSIGYTSGCGHFHISESIFQAMRQYLIYLKDSYANDHQFGNGPNWRFRVIRKSLTYLGMNPDLIKHGFSREVFFCPIASNAISFLSGKSKSARYKNLMTVAEVSEKALSRWMIPRSERNQEYRKWSNSDFLAAIMNQHLKPIKGLTKIGTCA